MISEKSLELNITENLLRVTRNYFSRAFAYGFTLRQEARVGLDVSINLPYQSKIFCFQFKRPVSHNPPYLYRFLINNNITRDQHLKLYLVSIVLHHIFRKDIVFYSFPCFSSTYQLAHFSPNFLSQTFFVSPRVMPRGILDFNVHLVEIDSNSGKAAVFSDFVGKFRTVRGHEFVKQMVIEQDNTIEVGILIEKLRKLENQHLLDILRENDSPPALFKLLEKNWFLKLRCLALW